MNPQNDIVFTDIKFAKRIIDYFQPQYNVGDKFFDPCKGTDGHCIHSDKEGGVFHWQKGYTGDTKWTYWL